MKINFHYLPIIFIIFCTLIIHMSFATDLDNCTIISTSGTYALNQTISGAPFDIPEIQASSYACIKVGVDNVEFDCNGFSILESGAPGLTWGMAANSSSTSNVTVKNCYFEGYDVGINLVSQSNSLIYNNTINNTVYTPISVNTANNVVIANNRIMNAVNTQNPEVNINTGSGNLIENNSLSNGYGGIYLRTDNSIIRNNNITSHGYEGINVGSQTNISIYSNLINNTGSNGGIYLIGTTNSQVFDNSVYNSVYYGITAISAPSSINFTNNVMNGMRRGFHFTSLTLSLISNNSISGVSEYGMYIQSSSDSLYTNNTINASTSTGILSTGSARNQFIANNILSTSGSIGINMDSSSSSLIDSNIISNYNTGIFLSSSANNNISNTNISGSSNGMYITSFSTGALVSNNTVYGGGNGYLIQASTGIYSNNVANGSTTGFNCNSGPNNVQIINSTAFGGTTGFSVSGCASTLLSNVTSYSNSQYGIYIDSSSSSSIINSSIFNNSVTAGIYATSLSNLLISNNNFSNDKNYAIFCSSCTSPNINSNIFDVPTGGYYGIGIDSSTNGFITQNVINDPTNSGNDGILVNSASSGFIIDSNNVSGFSNGGITISQSSSNNITNNYLFRNPNRGLYFPYAGNNNFASNNLFDNGGIAVSTFVTIDSASNNKIVNNYFNSTAAVNIGLYALDNFGINPSGDNVTNNTFNGETSNAVFMYHHNNIVVDSNTMHNCNLCLLLWGNNGATVKNNNVYNADYGIYFIFSSTGSVQNNNVYNMTSADIYAQQSSAISAINNTAHNAPTGIYYVSTTSSLLANNTAYSNSQYGIYILRSDHSIVQNSLLFNNSLIGLSIEDTKNVSSTGNQIFNNTLGSKTLAVAPSNYYSFYNADHLYNNTQDLEFNSNGGSTINISLTDVIFDHALGDFTDYSNISLNSTLFSGDHYSLNWVSNNTLTYPPSFGSFANKLINISLSSGSISINRTIMNYADSELSGYDESQFFLSIYNGSGWYLLDGSRDVTSNSVIANQILQPGILAIIYETLPPDVSLDSPANNTRFNSSNVVFNFTVIDNFATILNCSLYIDGVLNSTNSSTLNNTLTSINVTDIPDGQHFWNVSCFDLSNNQGNSSTFNFTVNTTIPDFIPPNIVLNSPTNNSNFSISNVTFNFTTIDNQASAMDCILYLDELANETNSSTLNNTATLLTVSSIADGNHSWYVNCSDLSGNSNVSQIRYFVVDTLPPIIDLNDPAPGSLLSSNISFNFTAVDELSDTMSCSLKINGTIIDTNSSTLNNTPTIISVSGIADGYYAWNVSCTDLFGNTDESSPFDFTVDSPPNITLISPTDGSTVNSLPIDFEFSATDSEQFGCSLILDDTMAASNSSVSNGTTTLFSISSVSDGSHSWYVNCTDDNFNSVNSSIKSFTYSTSSLTPSSSTSTASKLKQMSVSSHAFCYSSTLTFSDSSPLSNVRVVANDNLIGYTNSSGNANINACGSKIKLYASLENYEDLDRDILLADCICPQAQVLEITKVKQFCPFNELQLKITINGTAIENAIVNSSNGAKVLSDKDGLVTFVMPQNGTYLFSGSINDSINGSLSLEYSMCPANQPEKLPAENEPQSNSENSNQADKENQTNNGPPTNQNPTSNETPASSSTQNNDLPQTTVVFFSVVVVTLAVRAFLLRPKR